MQSPANMRKARLLCSRHQRFNILGEQERHAFYESFLDFGKSYSANPFQLQCNNLRVQSNSSVQVTLRRIDITLRAPSQEISSIHRGTSPVLVLVRVLPFGSCIGVLETECLEVAWLRALVVA